ncbi:MAG: HNH endonuclease [Treponema sp.]|nr:HNH endonuclease [Treponema sp.]
MPARHTPEIIAFFKENAGELAGKTSKELAELVYSRFGVCLTIRAILRVKLRCGIRYGKPYARALLSETTRKGFARIKLSDSGKFLQDWQLKHRYLWEQANGTIPENHYVIFADQNRSNFELDNLLCIPKNVLSYIAFHGLLSADAEQTKSAIAIAQLALKIKERKKDLSPSCQKAVTLQSKRLAK